MNITGKRRAAIAGAHAITTDMMSEIRKTLAELAAHGHG